MTLAPVGDFHAIVSQARAELAQRQTAASHYGSFADSPVLIAVDEYSRAIAPAPDDRGELEDLHALLLEARAHRIQIGAPTSPCPISSRLSFPGWPGWHPRHAPHESAFPPAVVKTVAGGPRPNRRARRGAAHRRGSSS
ncbi:hypothetical protein [Mycolicibacterium mucogenicum]|jgi:hypothetical protein|uniref:hypothetical protein n=1 Tax=Mycolicibacterium mucogenicum TaxID=56689 RepID=UPI00076A8614|nr:hypothetical protein [Mycolicibacterium mucogenicum]